MAKRNMIAIGGSAGSIQALQRILRDLPKDLPAAVFVVVHTRTREWSALPHVLANSCRLRVTEAQDRQWIETGSVYISPPDRHMLIAGDHLHLSRGPKEGLHRPSINATFRSAAACCDGHMVGVLLSGMMDDGASGLWEITQRHGVSIIQDPGEAQFPSMPMSALEAVPINFILKAGEIGSKLTELVTLPKEMAMVQESTANEISNERFSGFTCPECRGPLYEHRDNPPEFRCRVGHIFSLGGLIEEETATQERKMYEAIVSLEEGADMAEYAADRASGTRREQLVVEARQLRKHSAAIRGLIEERKVPPLSD